MKKLSVLASAMLVLLLAGLGAGTANASPPIDRHQLNASACDGGTLVINISHQVTNDADSGFYGAWARDSYTRQIQVWQTGPNTFCALVDYGGSFVTDWGRTPQDGTPLDPGITGNISGGYRATIAGSLKTADLPPLTGNLGSMDYNCDEFYNCTDRFDWVSSYFQAGLQFTYQWWGWTYRTASNGTWVNACEPSEGPGCVGSSGGIVPSANSGFDQYGYNATARLFNGTAANWCLATSQPADCEGAYSADKLLVNWNAAWDACYAAGGADASVCAGAWITNQWNGAIPGGSGEMLHMKMVWVGPDLESSPLWIDGGLPYGYNYEIIMYQGTGLYSEGVHDWLVHVLPNGLGG